MIPALRMLDISGESIAVQQKELLISQRAEGQDRDERDAAAIYDLLEKVVVPLFYDVDVEGIPHGWVRMIKKP